MYDWATIFPDGSMKMDGFVPLNWRLLQITKTHAVVHSPGSHWSDNGGRHYGESSIEVKEIVELRRGNAPGTWRLKFKRLSQTNLSFHPTVKEATKRAARLLECKGDELARKIEENRS